MNDIKEIIDLGSYSSSNGFIGYFECSGDFENNGVDEAVKHFCDYFLSGKLKIKAYSSLFVDDDFEYLLNTYGINQAHVDEILMPLVKRQWVKLIDFNAFGNDYESEEYENKLEMLRESFHDLGVIDLSDTTLIKSLFMMLMLGVGGGHFFFNVEGADLFIYPHDDVGFGVVCGNKIRGCEVGVDYLASLKNNVRFNVEINKIKHV